MAGLAVLASARIKAALTRAFSVYGLLAAGCLILVFAAGYALDAGRAALAFRYGPVLASLTIAAGLLAAAGLLVGVAGYLRRQPRPMTSELEKASPFSTPPYPAPYSIRRLGAIASAGAGAACAGLVIYLVRDSRRTIVDEQDDDID